MVDPAMSAAMAETALWATLGLHRRFFHYARQQTQAQWRPMRQLSAQEITVAVLGLGQLGACTARRLAQQGYRVIGFSTGRGTLPDIPCAHGLAALPAVLAEADVVINLMPLTAETRGLFDAQRLSALKPRASLVNLARGAHVVEADLLAALDAEKLQHAVLDVFASEPLPPEHPFWRHPRVTVLPHVAAQTDPRSASLVVAQQILALREGRPLMHLVDRSRGY
jgi:glyoxylate/hydroxypyruvate reductase A